MRVDNLTHTLVGAALGYAGLNRRTGLAMPALMVAANLPDIDVACGLFGEGLSGRRGWTHGPVGLLVLPAMLALVLAWYDRWQERTGRRPPSRAPVQLKALMLLSYIGAISHPVLDLMNSWGIRLLMPFSERWFYGDALFIADPWIWLALGGGIWLSRQRARREASAVATPAIASLLAVTLYSSAMALAGRAAENRVALQLTEMGLGAPQRVLANPVFANPFRRQIIVQLGDRYGFGDFHWLRSPQLTLDRSLVPTNMDAAAIPLSARQDRAVVDFLYWARYPFADIRPVPGRVKVALGDARFGNSPDAGLIGVTTTIPEVSAHP